MARGVDVTNDPSQDADAILVLAGTRHLLPLWKARRARDPDRAATGWPQLGAPRPLGGTALHRSRHLWQCQSFLHPQASGGPCHLPEPVHQALVGGLVQPARVPSSVILNGVDLNRYTPHGLHERPSSHYRLLVVEGSLAGGQNYGIYNALSLANALSKKFKIELMVVGRVDGRTKNKLKNQTAFRHPFMDTIAREQIPWMMRSSHLLYLRGGQSALSQLGDRSAGLRIARGWLRYRFALRDRAGRCGSAGAVWRRSMEAEDTGYPHAGKRGRGSVARISRAFERPRGSGRRLRSMWKRWWMNI